MCGGATLTLNSCSNDEPEMEMPGDGDDANSSDVENPGEDQTPGEEETPGDEELPGEEEDPNEEEKPGNGYDAVDLPDEFAHPMEYVIIPSDLESQYRGYTSFSLSFNKDNHTANYVSWQLMRAETNGSVKRDDYNYWVDKTLEGCLDTDYGYSTYGYERGHMCPAADNRWSKEAMRDCMSMANMSPQLRALNSGLWGKLEDNERTLAKKYGAIWIVAGPLYYDTDDLYIGRAQARVPSAYFKVFLYEDGENSEGIAYVLQNGPNPGNIQDYAMSIDDLESETGFDFFPALPDEIENKVESTFNVNFWK